MVIEDGIIGVDNTARKCPVCGYEPRIHVHKFKMLEMDDKGKEQPITVRRSYYDCSVCGQSITDWADDPYVEKRGQKKYIGYGAKELWDKRKFL